MAVRKPFLKDKESDRDQKKGKDREEGKERKDQDDEEAQTPQRQIQFDGADEDAETDKKQEPAENRQISARRIWGKKGFSTSKALYEIAAAPHRVEKTKKSITSHQNEVPSDQETRALPQQISAVKTVSH
jgi:hypothetical protein